MKRAGRNSGVTLVEVLLAAVVVGAGLAVILSAISTSIRAEMNADLKVKAARLLELQLGRIEGGVVAAETGVGDFIEDGESLFTWSSLVEETDQANLTQLTLTVHWTEHGDARDLDLVRLIYTDPDAGSTLGGATGATTQTQVGSGSIAKTGSSTGSSGSSSSSGSASGSSSSGPSGASGASSAGGGR